LRGKGARCRHKLGGFRVQGARVADMCREL